VDVMKEMMNHQARMFQPMPAMPPMWQPVGAEAAAYYNPMYAGRGPAHFMQQLPPGMAVAGPHADDVPMRPLAQAPARAAGAAAPGGLAAPAARPVAGRAPAEVAPAMLAGSTAGGAAAAAAQAGLGLRRGYSVVSISDEDIGAAEREADV
jgi:hypothetical protein